MRELKFRAWDKKRNRYVGDGEIVFKSYGSEAAVVVCPNSQDYIGDICHDEYIDDGRFVVEQYTGLKDKFGKEIYEGDIVKARWRRAKHARLDTKGEIKFNDGWFYVDDDPDGQDRLGVPIHNCYSVEVVGNIHENPEILEDEK